MSTLREDPGPASGEKIGVGETLGRYRITSQLGSGGMGEVFLAVDPQLDRQVALKVLHTGDRSPAGVTRLLREAKAMARVSHRNVVAVYDAGEVGLTPWVAMELIRGTTLRGWLEAKPRTWVEILKVLIEAGRGLEAAHAAGLVHRDFKPENVLVEDGGRVVVSDFGIASGVLEPDVPLAAPSSTRLDERITAAGALMGTPAYMAPEQHAGRTDARSDQYAFAVTAREVLSGVQARALATPLTNETAVQAPPNSKRADVPSKLWRTLGRALHSDPADRFESMGVMLAELEVMLPKPRSYAWVAIIPLVAAGAGVIALTRPQRCDTGPELFAPAWTAERQSKLGLIFGNTVVSQLDGFAQRWLTMHREACEATVSGAQSSELLDQRMACLRRRQSDFSALASRLESKGKELEEVAPGAIRALGDVSECADTQSLSGRPAIPPAQKTEIDALGVRLSDLKALDDLGQYREVLEPGAKLAEEARKLGYAPLEAEVLRVYGRAQHLTDAIAESEKTFEQAIIAAERARDDRLRANLHALRAIVFLNTGRLKECSRDLTAGAAIAERVGDRKVLLKIRGLEADVASAEGRFVEAEKLAREVVETDEAAVPLDERVLLGDLNTWATALRQTNRLEEAAKQWERAIGLGRKVLAPKDPGMAVLLAQWSDTQAQLGKLDAGQEAHDEAVRIFAEAVGPRTEPVAESHSNWGRFLAEAGKLGPAREVIELSLAIRREQADPQPLAIADALVNLALVSMLERKDADADKQLSEAMPLLEKTLGHTNPSTIGTFMRLAVVRARLGKGKEALTMLDDARARMDEAAKGGITITDDNTFELALDVAEAKSTLRDCEGAKAALESVKNSAANEAADPQLRKTWTAMSDSLSKGCVTVRSTP
ncbi:MAG: protein kinase [Archangium sp.]